MENNLLPFPKISPIANNEPEATPELFNSRYEEIDRNFGNLNNRQNSTEQEIEAARGGAPSLAKTISAIIDQIGGLSGSLSDAASGMAIQRAIQLDLEYRNRRVDFEFFLAGFSWQNHLGVGVISGVAGDDSLDVESTDGLIQGSEYLLSDGGIIERIKIDSILTKNRLRLTKNLTRHISSTGILTGCTFVAQEGGGAIAQAGDQWITKELDLGSDYSQRSVVIRHNSKACKLNLSFFDTTKGEWVPAMLAGHREGQGIPAGQVDSEFLFSMRGKGRLLLVVEDAGTSINHIAMLGSATGLGGTATSDDQTTDTGTTDDYSSTIDPLLFLSMTLARTVSSLNKELYSLNRRISILENQ